MEACGLLVSVNQHGMDRWPLGLLYTVYTSENGDASSVYHEHLVGRTSNKRPRMWCRCLWLWLWTELYPLEHVHAATDQQAVSNNEPSCNSSSKVLCRGCLQVARLRYPRDSFVYAIIADRRQDRRYLVRRSLWNFCAEQFNLSSHRLKKHEIPILRAH